MRDIDPPASVRRPESVLRRLIRAEYLTVADWDVALNDTARMAREASGADEALVAIFQPAPARWTAVTSGGESLADKEISLVASLSVLESVLESGEPIRATAGSPVLSRSLSASRNLVSSVVAVPLRFSVAESRSDVRVGGCLYADRRNGEPFTEEDAENLLDIARLTERTLNALAHLRHLQRLLAEAEQRGATIAKRRSSLARSTESRPETLPSSPRSWSLFGAPRRRVGSESSCSARRARGSRTSPASSTNGPRGATALSSSSTAAR